MSKAKKIISPRLSTVYVLQDVLNKGESLTAVLSKALDHLPAAQDRSLAQALSYGVLRWYHRLEALSKLLLKKPFRKKDFDLHLLLLMGLYQLIEQRVPDYAAVSETVAMTDVLKKSWAKGVLNGVLRTFLRERESLNARLDKEPISRFSFPGWMLKKVQQDWPDDWESMLLNSNLQAPMVLRFNQQQQQSLTKKECLEVLKNAGIESETLPGLEDAILLKKACDVETIPGFMEGALSVQDGAAQLAARLLAPEPGDHVLDACAAPGGKTSHLLEVQSQLKHLTAIDIEPNRLSRVKENLIRLNAEWLEKVTLMAADVADTNHWWDGQLFNCILLDAPCSASGVIRRHPDIKLLRKPGDIENLVNLQAELLKKMWDLLMPGGRLLYATCSLFKQENEDQIDHFLSNTSDAELLEIELEYGVTRPSGLQILTGQQDMDGFYYALLKKRV